MKVFLCFILISCISLATSELTCFTCSNCEVFVMGQQTRCDGQTQPTQLPTIPGQDTTTTPGLPTFPGQGTTTTIPGLPTFPGQDTTTTTPGLPTFPGQDTTTTTPGLPTFPGQDTTTTMVEIPTFPPFVFHNNPHTPSTRRKRELLTEEYWTREWSCFAVRVQGIVNRGCVRSTGSFHETCVNAANGNYQDCMLCDGNLCNNSRKLFGSISVLLGSLLAIFILSK